MEDMTLSTRQTHSVTTASLAAAILLVYFNSWTNDFISDDIAGILNNPTLSDFGYIIRHGAHPASILFYLIRHLAGLNTVFFHLNNTFWHVGVTILLYIMVYLLTKHQPIAWMTGLLFAVHPIHTEAVSWISGLPYLLYSFFSLLTLTIVIAIDKGVLPKRWIIAATLSAYISFVASEKAIILPVILILYFLLFSRLKKGVLLVSPVVFSLVIFAVSFVSRIGNRITSANPSYEGGTVVFNPLIQIPIAITTYLKLLFFPIGLTFYHEDLSFSVGHYALYAGITLAFFLFIFICFLKKKKLLTFSSLFFIIGLAPMLLPIRISWVVAERYVYFSSIGFCIVLAVFLNALKKAQRYVFIGVFSVLLLFFVFLTIRRNLDWTSQDTLWPATVVTSPTSSLAHNNMGDYYSRKNDIPAAIREFSLAVKLMPTYAEAMHNLANMYLRQGDATKAGELYQRALAVNPNILESALNLGDIAMKRGDYQSALIYLKRAQEINPDSPLTYNALGAYYGLTGDTRRAIELLRKAVSMDPTNEQARKNLQFFERRMP